jgi:arginase
VSAQPDGQRVAVIGAALDLGQSRRGVDMGPSAIRYAGLAARLDEIGRQPVDWGNVEAAVQEAVPESNERARYLPEIKTTCARIARLVGHAVDEGFMPLVLGGDHSVALGTLGALSGAYGPGGVLWVDAHGDLNTPQTSSSGNVHGMVLAAALGVAGPDFESEAWTLPAVEPGRVALVGLRSLDAPERELLRSLDARVYTMSDVDRIGIERAIRESLAHIAGSGFVHVSLDMDAIDPVAESGLVGSLEVVEVNPILDRENQTAKLAVELIASALGARIF